MKDVTIAYLLWFFTGCHYFYLKKYWLQFFYIITLGGFGIWMLADVFRIPSMVAEYNKKVINA
jgi:hypothetical protein